MAIQIVSGNLNEYGNSGTFEDVTGTWGFTVGGFGTLTRDGTLFYQGLYSQKNTSASDYNLGGTFAATRARYSNYDASKKYILRARVRVDSGLQLAGDTSELEWNTGTKIATVTILNALDTWVNVESRISGLAGNVEATLNIIRRDADVINIGDPIYVDAVEILEYIDVETCDLLFNLANCNTVNATTAITADGKIQLGNGANPGFDKGDDSGDVKINLGADFNYASEGTALPALLVYEFSGLPPGSYTVYARTSASCLRTATFIVEATKTYNVRHRLEFHDTISTGVNRKWRLDISELDYVGAISDATGYSQSPVMYEWEVSGTQDIFERKVIGSKITVTLNIETDGQYDHFFTYDERQFRANLYLWNGSSYDMWQEGYLLPMLWREEYVLTNNNPLTLVFTDGLADLAQIPFADRNGNFPEGRISLLTAIRYCLLQTNINYDIIDACNILSDTLPGTAADSILTNAYISTELFRENNEPIDCLRVLEIIMGGLFSRLYFAEGLWRIELLTQKTASSVPFRRYTLQGVYVSNSTAAPRIRLRTSAPAGASARVMWKDASQMYEFIEQFGTFVLNQKTNIEKPINLLNYGSFKSEEIVNGQISGWTINSIAAPSASVALEARQRESEDYAFSVLFNVFEPNSEYIILTSETLKWKQETTPTKLKIKFDLYTVPIFTTTYVYIDFALAIGGQIYDRAFGGQFAALGASILDPAGGSANATTIDGGWNRIYIDKHQEWQTLEFEAYIPASSISDGDLTLQFRLPCNDLYDFSNLGGLRAFYVPDGAVTGITKKRVKQSFFALDFIYEYTAVVTAETESSPNIIRSNVNTNMGWVLDRKYSLPKSGATEYEAWLQKVMIDNVEVGYYPNSTRDTFNNPAAQVSSTFTIGPAIKNKLTVDVDFFDIGSSGLNNNYGLVSRGWLSRLSAGVHVPISGNWYRRGVTESLTFSDLYVQMLRGQYTTPRRKYTGSFDTRYQAISLWNTVQEYRTGIIGLLTGLAVDCAGNSASVEFIEALRGSGVTDTGEPVVPAIEPPVLLEEFTTEFTTEFS